MEWYGFQFRNDHAGECRHGLPVLAGLTKTEKRHTTQQFEEQSIHTVRSGYFQLIRMDGSSTGSPISTMLKKLKRTK